MGAGQLGCDAEQNVEIFVINTDTQLVDTKQQELFCTVRMFLGLHMENNCRKGKKYHNWLICPIIFPLFFYFKLEIKTSTYNEDNSDIVSCLSFEISEISFFPQRTELKSEQSYFPVFYISPRFLFISDEPVSKTLYPEDEHQI